MVILLLTTSQSVRSRDSSVGIALGYGMDDRDSGVRFPGGGGLGSFLFTTVSRTSLGPTQPPIQWVRGALLLGVKRPGREADHSPPLSVGVKECVELYLHSPNTPSWRGAQLKYRDNFPFTFNQSVCPSWPRAPNYYFHNKLCLLFQSEFN
jgi:hypothetical protein